MNKNSQFFHTSVSRSSRWQLTTWGSVILLISLFFNMQTPSIVHASAIDVNSLNDTRISGDGECTLREAIINANGGVESTGGDCISGSAGLDTLNLISGTYTLTHAEGDLYIDGDIIINGTGIDSTIIDGNNTARVIYLASGNMDLNDLTIQDGQVGTLSNTGNGGGIQIKSSGTINITRVNFLNNFAGFRGGGIDNDGGTLTLTDCLFSENISYRGAGMVSTNTNSHTTINNTVFYSNTAHYYGGGLDLNAGTVTVDNSTFTENESIGDGGAIVNDGGDLTVTNSVISNNKATVNPNFTSGLSGGIHVKAGTATVSNTTISGNRADAGGGGVNVVYGTINLSNVTIAYNIADDDNTDDAIDDGGGVRRANATGAHLNLRNSIVVHNIDRSDADQNDCGSNAITSLGHNLTGVDNATVYCDVNGTSSGGTDLTTAGALLSSLANNGGSTETHALLTGSPAIDAGDDGTCTPTDQRGTSRHDGDGDGGTDACDIGAYESGTMKCNINSGNSYVFAAQSNIGFLINSKTDLDCLYVEEMLINHPNATGNEETHLNTGKFWRLDALQTDKFTPATTFNLDLTLPFATADDMTRACKWLEGTGAGFGWDCFGNVMPTTYVLNSSVTREDVTVLSASEWAVGENVGPTAVFLQSTTTTTQPTGWVVLLFSALMLTGGALSVYFIKRPFNHPAQS